MPGDQYLDLVECVAQVGDEVGYIFDADGDADEVFSDAHLVQRCRGDGEVRHRSGVLDKAFDASEGFGQGEDADGVEEAEGFFTRTTEAEGEGSSEAGGLLQGKLMLRVRGLAGVQNLRDLRVRFQPVGDGKGVAVVLFHADGEGAKATQYESAIAG